MGAVFFFIYVFCNQIIYLYYACQNECPRVCTEAKEANFSSETEVHQVVFLKPPTGISAIRWHFFRFFLDSVYSRWSVLQKSSSFLISCTPSGTNINLYKNSSYWLLLIICRPIVSWLEHINWYELSRENRPLRGSKSWQFLGLKVTRHLCCKIMQKSDPPCTFPSITLLLDHLSKICMILYWPSDQRCPHPVRVLLFRLKKVSYRFLKHGLEVEILREMGKRGVILQHRCLVTLKLM